MDSRTRQQRHRLKTRDRSIALLILTVVMFFPPVGMVSLIEVNLGGIPMPVAYLFAVWILAIIAALLLADPLQKTDASDAHRPSNDDNRA